MSGDVLALPVLPGELTPAAIRGLVGRDDPLIVEVGANAGQTTRELLHAMPRATLHAFEPDPRAIAKFRQQAWPPGVRLHECALGAVAGQATFHQSAGEEHLPGYEAGWDQSGSIHRPLGHLQKWPWIRFDRQITVPVTTLDAWAAEQGITAVDFIWSDAQGAEGDLIDGASGLLPRVRYLYTEYCNGEIYEGQPDLAQLAAKLPDFELVRRFQWDALFRNRRWPA